MILNVSGRTDIVAFYTKWFMNRYKEGYVMVRNPFNYHLVNEIYFEDVDLIVFCTKNPLPIIDRIKEIDKPIKKRKYDKEDLEKRREKISVLMKQGLKQKQIADLLGVAQNTISREKKKIMGN